MGLLQEMTWLPGQSGNPDGNRRTKPLRDAIAMELAMMADGRIDEVPKLSLRNVFRQQVIKAAEGDTNAYHAVLDRIEGKPKQTIAGDEENPLQLALSRGLDARDMIASAIGRLVGHTIEGEVVSVDSTKNEPPQAIDKPSESK